MLLKILHCAPMTPQAFVKTEADGVSILLETRQGLTLVDTGLGLHDHLAPDRYMKLMRKLMGWHRNPEATAARQLLQLGIPPAAVKHIILSHAHFDHAGGLPDFPNAQVHLRQRELDAIHHPRRFLDLVGHHPVDFAHAPDWCTYGDQGKDWHGFRAIPLPFTPRIYLVELFGHTNGHCGVLIEKGNSQWLLYTGDAAPTGLDYGMAPDWLMMLALGKASLLLKDLIAAHPEIEFIPGHVWVEEQ